MVDELNALKNDIKAKNITVIGEQNKLKKEILSGKWDNINDVLSEENMKDYYKKAEEYIDSNYMKNLSESEKETKENNPIVISKTPKENRIKKEKKLTLIEKILRLI